MALIQVGEARVAWHIQAKCVELGGAEEACPGGC